MIIITQFGRKAKRFQKNFYDLWYKFFMICAAAITMERIVPPAVFYLKSQVPRLCTVEKIWFMTRCGSGVKKGGDAQEKISPRLRKKYSRL